MKRKKQALLVVAHPDDESIFFGGLVLSTRKHTEWTIICVTDGNADGFGKRRKKEFQKACKSLGAKNFHWLGFHDVYEKRIPINELKKRLLPFVRSHNQLYTHGIIGEYGHPHHQDASLALHAIAAQSKKEVWSPAYNSYPEKTIHLTKADYKKKCEILSEIYGLETQKFLNLIPATYVEGFHRCSIEEVREIYAFLSDEKLSLNRKHLKNYKWYARQIIALRKAMKKRPF